MPELTSTHPSAAQRTLDRQLLFSLALPPLAAGISTIIGYIVAHWITLTTYKRFGYLVSAVGFAMCASAALLALSALRKLDSGNGTGCDDTCPEGGRQLFMAKLALLLSALCGLVILAGTLVLITLRPND